MSIPIIILHTVSETDFGDYHSWSMPGLSSARNDEPFIRGKAEDIVSKLGAVGIEAHVEVHNGFNPYPRDL